MKRLGLKSVMVAVLLVAGTVVAGETCTSESCGKKSKDQSVQNVEELSTDQLKALLASESAPVVLDARTGKFDDGRRIPGAKSLNAGSSAEEVQAVVADKHTPVVTYCSNLKCPASAQLAAHLRKLGYTNVKEYPQGIEGWVEAGHPVVETKPAPAAL